MTMTTNNDIELFKTGYLYYDFQPFETEIKIFFLKA